MVEVYHTQTDRVGLPFLWALPIKRQGKSNSGSGGGKTGPLLPIHESGEFSFRKRRTSKLEWGFAVL